MNRITSILEKEPCHLLVSNKIMYLKHQGQTIKHIMVSKLFRDNPKMIL
jgi:hypothetical protein